MNMDIHMFMGKSMCVTQQCTSKSRLTPRTVDCIVGKLSDNLATIVDGNTAARAYGIGFGTR